METEIMSASDVGLELTNLLMPFISALVLLVITLWFKDFAVKIAKGMAFKMDKAFNEGDSVIFEGQDSVIVKIGLTTTVFGHMAKEVILGVMFQMSVSVVLN